MSNGIYDVGVHLTATNGVSGVLSAIGAEVLGLHGSVQHLQQGLSSLKIGAIGAVVGAAGIAIGHMTEKLIAHGMEIEHWTAQMAAAGADNATIAEGVGTAWANAGRNVNASAAESLKNIIELNKATGDWHESMNLLPTFSFAQTAMHSVKAEDLHSQFNAGTQTLNFARGLEELGVTQMGKTEEERQASIEKYTKEMMRTMISSRGLFDGNALYAMTNNSGGAAQNWDMRMATVVAPIIGDIMKAGKLGNADYMALKGYQGGHITSDAAEALTKYGLAKLGEANDPNADVYEDKKGFHLKANSGFAKGMESNIWDWSGQKLEALKAHGVDISDQHAMNAVVNEIGSNKSLSMLMRAVLEPLTRLQIEKEMNLRDKVPDDAAGVLQNKDPFLKLDAFHKKWDDFLTALGGPMVDPAMKVLDTLTRKLNDFSQWAAQHPDDMQTIGIGLMALSAGLTALGTVLIGGAIIAAIGTGGWLIAGLAALGTALAAFEWLRGAKPQGEADPGMKKDYDRPESFADLWSRRNDEINAAIGTWWSGVTASIAAKLSSRNEEINTALSGMWTSLKDSITSGAKGAATAISSTVTQIGTDLTAAARALPGQVNSALSSSVTAISTAIQQDFSGLGEKASTAIHQIGNAFVSAIAALPGEVGGAISSAVGSIGSMISGALSHLNPFSSGGAPSPAPPSTGRQGPPSPPGTAGGRVHTGMADTRPQEHHIYLDGKKIAHVVGRQMASAANYPHSAGGYDTHGYWAPPSFSPTDAG